MANDTFIVLCDFSQGDLMNLVAGGARLKKQAKDLGDSLPHVKVQNIWVTAGDFNVVAIVKAPSAEEARKIDQLFTDIGEPDTTTIVKATTSVTQSVVDAFNGHTKV